MLQQSAEFYSCAHQQHKRWVPQHGDSQCQLALVSTAVGVHRLVSKTLQVEPFQLLRHQLVRQTRVKAPQLSVEVQRLLAGHVLVQSISLGAVTQLVSQVPSKGAQAERGNITMFEYMDK